MYPYPVENYRVIFISNDDKTHLEQQKSHSRVLTTKIAYEAVAIEATSAYRTQAPSCLSAKETEANGACNRRNLKRQMLAPLSVRFFYGLTV